MNILGDFITRVNNLYPEEIDNEQLEGLLTTIKNQGDEIEMKDKEISRLQAKLAKIESAAEQLRSKIDKKKAAPKKASTSKKASTKGLSV